MKKLKIFILAVLFGQYIVAQNVGINTDGSTPTMMLDVKPLPTATSDGIRINNPNTGDGDAILNFQNNGTSVWTIGFDDSDNDDLKISNSATLGTTNALTIDGVTRQVLAGTNGTNLDPVWSFENDDNTGMYRSAADFLNFSTAGSERFEMGTSEAVFNDISANYDVRIEGDGDDQLVVVDAGNDRVGIGTNTPTTKLDVSSGSGNAVYGHSSNVGGYLGYESNFSFGIVPQSVLGAGVWAANPSSGYTSFYAQSTGSANVAATIAYSSVWIPTYSYGDYGGTNTPSASYAYMNYTNNSNTAFKRAVTAFCEYTGTGTTGFTTASVNVALGNGEGASGSWSEGYSNTEDAYGGYFLGEGGGAGYYAYIADDWNNRKITGTGTVSEIIPTENHGRITLTCPESPEYWYQDYYTVDLINGKATLYLDPILSDIIIVDDNNPIQVYCTPVSMTEFNGVSVFNQTSISVDLIELNGGKHSGKLQVQVVVKPKTNYGEGRFSQAPAPASAKNLNLPNATTKNQNRAEGRDIFEWPADWQVYGYENEHKNYKENVASQKASLESDK